MVRKAVKYKEEVREVVDCGILRQMLGKRDLSSRAIDYIVEAVDEVLEEDGY